jgi:TonB-linked SusC/RagA family outer membrane protein
MRAIITFLCLLLFLINEAAGQERVLTGKVSDSNGTVLPGVNIALKGTNRGTSTNSRGEYSINAEPRETLVFSFIGFATSEVTVGNQSVINVSLKNDVSQLQEVVVTALGQERKRNELVYAAQQVTADQMTQTRQTNVANALAGKVAGLDIRSTNTMGGSTNVVIRGYKSITGNNQALFVIDGVPVSNATTNTADQQAGRAGVDYGNAAADINPDNISSISVLKGAAATALYGSRASNGVIMITTKKGRKNSFDVTLNSGVTWGQMDKTTFAKYQNEYGAGYGGDRAAGKFYLDGDLGSGKFPIVRFDDDASFGAKFDANLQVYHWDALDPYSPNFGKTRSWVAAKNGPATFYETSHVSNHSVNVSGGGENSTFKVGYTRSDEKGVLPNSNLKKNQFNFSGSYDLTKKLSVQASINFTQMTGIGRYNTGYNGKNPNQGFRQWWQMNVDVQEQKEAYFRNDLNVSWNWANHLKATYPIFADNPYYQRYKNYANDGRTHFQGNTGATYKIYDWVDFTGRFAYDGTNDFQEERVSVGSSGTPSYARYNRAFYETNLDLLLNFHKAITKDISFSGLLGSNMRRSSMLSIRGQTNGGLVVPNLYSLSNSVASIEAPIESVQKIGVDGIFGQASFGYKELINLEFAARQDKSTTLPKGDNTYFYPSIGGNFNFSNLEVLKFNWLTDGKLRANYAEVGNDATWGSVYDVYDKPTGIGSVPYFSLPHTKNNNALRSERTKSMEVGIEAAFLDDRIGFDVTAYKTKSLDQILPVTVTSSTGYTARYVNAGSMHNRGVEISIYATLLKTADFSWNVSLNYTRNRNKVVSLYGDVKNVQINPLAGGVSLNASIGEPFGVIKGTNYSYHTNGQKIIKANGIPQATSSTTEIIGNPNPDWLGGLTNTFKYKGVSLSFLIDMRHGGDLWSLDQWYGLGTGSYPITAGLNELGKPKRDPVAEGGGVLFEGVQADGTPNTVRAANVDGNSLSAWGYSSGQPRASVIYDAGFVKLREASLTYSLPQPLLTKLRAFKEISISVIGRNLWIIKKHVPMADPEDNLGAGLGNGAGGYQSGSYPALKSYGFNVKFRF